MLTEAAIVITLLVCAGAMLYFIKQLSLLPARAGNPHLHEIFRLSTESIFIVRADSKRRFFVEEANSTALSVITTEHCGQELARISERETGDRKRFLDDLLDALHSASGYGRSIEYESPLWHRSEHRAVNYKIRLITKTAGAERGQILCFMRVADSRPQTLSEGRAQNFRALVERSPDTVARYDSEGHRTYANPAFNLLAVTVTRKDAQWTTREYCGAGYQDKIRAVLSGGQEEEIECAWSSAAGRSMTSHIRLIPERGAAGQITGVLSIGRDITELKETEHHLRESRTLLRDLTARRELIEESARKEIAREMHEEYGQSLSAARMNIAMMRTRFGKTLPELGQKIDESLELLDHTIMQMRQIVSVIHPSVLNMGIASALEWLADDCLAPVGIWHEVRVDTASGEMDETSTRLVFKIAQIALSNVLRHAVARHVFVTLEKRDSDFRLEIRDDGIGFDLDRSKRDSLGLVEMEELSNMLEGEIVFLSEPGKGTLIEVCFPAKAPLRPALFEHSS
jgi:signal transduction histidine kinase